MATLKMHGWSHTWFNPRTPMLYSDAAGERDLRVAKRYAHKEGMALLLSMSLCTEVEGLGGRADLGVLRPPPGLIAPPVVHGGTEGRVGQDYVSSELALPCARSSMDTPPGDAGATASGAPGGRFVGGGCRIGSPIENRVACNKRSKIHWGQLLPHLVRNVITTHGTQSTPHQLMIHLAQQRHK